MLAFHPTRLLANNTLPEYQRGDIFTRTSGGTEYSAQGDE